jgi:ferrochelatase
MTAARGVDAVLLIAFGGPERREDVRPFLEIVTAGRRVPPERLEEVAHHYEDIGGRSPLNDITRRQADLLRELLARDGPALPVYVGMRNWHPFLRETLGEMRSAGRRRALGIILSPLRTEASWDRYLADVAAARATVGPDAPEVVFAPAWSDHPRFVDAMVERVGDALAAVPAERRADAPIVFTAHSVPVAMAEGSPYTVELSAAARRVAERLAHPAWTIAYQSRSGSPRDPWLEPDVGEAIRDLARSGARDVVIAPIGFVADHVEVLYDLDVEACAVAREVGVGFQRARTAGDHPAFIAMLAELVARAT